MEDNLSNAKYSRTRRPPKWISDTFQDKIQNMGIKREEHSYCPCKCLCNNFKPKGEGLHAVSHPIACYAVILAYFYNVYYFE